MVSNYQLFISRYERRMTMKIKVSQINEVLNDYVKRIKDKKIDIANALFIGERGIGKASNIFKWHSSSKDNYVSVISSINDVYDEIECIEEDLEMMRRNNKDLVFCVYDHHLSKISPTNETLPFQRSLLTRTAKDGLLNQDVLDDIGLVFAMAQNDQHIEKEILELFDIYEVEVDLDAYKAYINARYSPFDEIEDGCKEEFRLISHILDSSRFHFVFGDDARLSPNGLSLLLESSGGDKDLFMQNIGVITNEKNGGEIHDMLGDILSDYPSSPITATTTDDEITYDLYEIVIYDPNDDRLYIEGNEDPKNIRTLQKMIEERPSNFNIRYLIPSKNGIDFEYANHKYEKMREAFKIFMSDVSKENSRLRDLMIESAVINDRSSSYELATVICLKFFKPIFSLDWIYDHNPHRTKARPNHKLYNKANDEISEFFALVNKTENDLSLVDLIKSYLKSDQECPDQTKEAFLSYYLYRYENNLDQTDIRIDDIKVVPAS